MLSGTIKKLSGVIIGAVIFFSCDNDDRPETRSFYMGFTPFPYELSPEAVNYVYEKLEREADITNHHFNNGVPWAEALNDEPFPKAVTDDWNFRKNRTSAKHKIYVSVTPLNSLRNGLAAYLGEEDNMPLPEPWNTYSFNHQDVKAAYLQYCRRIIDFFKPDYFNMAIEANLLYVNSPAQWSAFLDLHEYIYTQLKATYPHLVIFTSVAGNYLLPGFRANNDYVQQRLAVAQLMEYSDLYGISFYPYLSSYSTNPYPDNTFSELFEVSDKPVAIAETGYAAQTFSMEVGSELITIESNQAKQQQYTQSLLDACEKRKAVFVINFVIRDYDQLWEQMGSPNDINIAWRDCGLYNENGTARTALNTWEQYLGRKYQHAE